VYCAGMCPLCRVSDHPLLIVELGETYLLLGENQGCPGWCVAVLKEHAEHMADLPRERQLRVFEDVARAVEAVRRVFGPVRINYECLGNVVPHIHWHVIPRHADDPTPREPVWGWGAERLRGTMPDEERAALAARLREALRAT
jgi:diadenosine tetraphosphate (Ap4A) HIT family hydrolase